ncbi:MAG: restriction endonuclease [Candidatus Hermodarchaeota archaeon]|nr:restriction endonuclease [Candidatus Hermodarchaeota archaeon]
MTNRRPSSQFSVISLILSLLGLVLLPLMLLNPPPSVVVLPWQTQLIGFAFMIICILGIIAGISPSHCSIKRKKRNQSQKEIAVQIDSPQTKSIRKEGHHPTCDHYSGHVITIKGSFYCAGCSGLVTGAIIAIIGTILFYFLSFPIVYTEATFWLGFVFVTIGLLQHPLYQLLKLNRGIIRFIINILFVVGSFLLLTSLIQLTNNLILAIYLLLLILYWIFTRIVMSRRSHHLICSRCNRPECPYSEA